MKIPTSYILTLLVIFPGISAEDAPAPDPQGHAPPEKHGHDPKTFIFLEGDEIPENRPRLESSAPQMKVAYGESNGTESSLEKRVPHPEIQWLPRWEDRSRQPLASIRRYLEEESRRNLLRLAEHWVSQRWRYDSRRPRIGREFFSDGWVLRLAWINENNVRWPFSRRPTEMLVELREGLGGQRLGSWLRSRIWNTWVFREYMGGAVLLNHHTGRFALGYRIYWADDGIPEDPAPVEVDYYRPEDDLGHINSWGAVIVPRPRRHGMRLPAPRAVGAFEEAGPDEMAAFSDAVDRWVATISAGAHAVLKVYEMIGFF